MIYLAATILLNVLISSLFKFFPRFGIDSFQAVVANYFFCVLTGCLFIGQIPFSADAVHAPWFPCALLMGVGFVLVFTLLVISTRKQGITTTTIANKLSLVIPAVFSVILYHEQFTAGKISGILLAFPAVYLASHRAGERSPGGSLWLPAMIFIGGGLLDTLMKFVVTSYLPATADQALYALCCFAVAGTAGLVVMVFLAVTKKTQLHWRNLVAGAAIGIPNYFSIYFMLRMLHSSFLESSAAIPVLNIGIVVVSAIVAMAFFREKGGVLRYTGVLLSILAIILIAFRIRS